MSNDDRQDNYGSANPTAAECISAGMYWFSQSDLAAAEAWWRRAQELEPENQRAKECLRLLDRTSSTGFKSDSWARLPATPQAPSPVQSVPASPALASPSAYSFSSTPTSPPHPHQEAAPFAAPSTAADPYALPDTEPHPSLQVAPPLPEVEVPELPPFDPQLGAAHQITQPLRSEQAGPSEVSGASGSPFSAPLRSNLHADRLTPVPPEESLSLGNALLAASGAAGLGPAPGAANFAASAGYADGLLSQSGSFPAPGSVPLPQHTPFSPSITPSDAYAVPTAEDYSSQALSSALATPVPPSLAAEQLPSAPDTLDQSTDPLDFATGSVRYESRAPTPLPEIPEASPWDEGPSTTSVVTLRASGEFDAVAEPTPLPDIDRERFFGREEPQSKQEIVEFLAATGDISRQDPAYLDAFEERSPSQPLPMISSESVDFGVAEMPISSSVDLLQQARDKFQLHDFQGVIDLLCEVDEDSSVSTEARNMLAESRAHLIKMLESKIGSFEGTPRVLVSSEEVIWLNLNHRAGFILSQIDGSVTYDDLIALSGMPRLDTLKILADLIDQKVIGAS